MLIVTLITFLFWLLYVVLIGGYICRWNKTSDYIPEGKATGPCFSVIIPFRDEEARLGGILHDLVLQDYPVEKFEVILVDDHSRDKSTEIAGEYCGRQGNFSLIPLSAGKSGKKNAIDTGIKDARHDYIITTDADCRAGRQWLSVMASFCNDFSPAMVIGLVRPESSGRSFPDFFQQLELISLTGAGAASALGGKPIFCSGANLCYRKELYSGIHDPMQKAIASGDDTFLLLQMKQSFRKDIRVLKSRLSFVTTKSEANFAGFIQQRSRWISKSTRYRDREILYSALVVFLANMAMLTAMGLMMAGYHPWFFAVMIMIKLLTDGYFLFSLSDYAGFKFNLAVYAAVSYTHLTLPTKRIV